ncbi:hypothetical protein LS482_20910 [Sinomicrobium kalidii]|uniref:hypothetical protein n=1 Tax=Sinomicrobium kalidii TaxID=2900738 RepID=UPI001E351E0C|nr:hypothetical protein [Sinomicrobium kalidii]UGU16125.1 hypothetical protein LS482_20910 [Sinomicrobium kalidii]
MEFTVHSIRDIESWLELYRTTSMDIDLHFYLKRTPDTPAENSLIDKNTNTNSLLDTPLKNAKGEEPFDWVKNKETGQYVWKEEVTSKENTPDGYDYIGRSENDVWKDYQNSESNGISRLYRKYMGAPDIDKGSFIDARNEDLKELVKEVFDAIKNRIDPDNFKPIDLDARGSGQYYGYNRTWLGVGDATYSGLDLQLEYEGIIFTATIGFNPVHPDLGIANSLSHVMEAWPYDKHSRANIFKITHSENKQHPLLYIRMDRDAFRQVYKELYGEDHPYFK